MIVVLYIIYLSRFLVINPRHKPSLADWLNTTLFWEGVNNVRGVRDVVLEMYKG